VGRLDESDSQLLETQKAPLFTPNPSSNAVEDDSAADLETQVAPTWSSTTPRRTYERSGRKKRVLDDSAVAETQFAPVWEPLPSQQVDAADAETQGAPLWCPEDSELEDRETEPEQVAATADVQPATETGEDGEALSDERDSNLQGSQPESSSNTNSGFVLVLEEEESSSSEHGPSTSARVAEENAQETGVDVIVDVEKEQTLGQESREENVFPDSSVNVVDQSNSVEHAGRGTLGEVEDPDVAPSAVAGKFFLNDAALSEFSSLQVFGINYRDRC
jgi:hypothetical protein